MITRFSVIPTHFSTAVFATCGVNFWSFAIATFLTLPKQIFLVYPGVLLLKPHPDGSVQNIVFGVAFALTVFMAVYIWCKMRAIKKVLLEEQAERRQARVLAEQREREVEAATINTADTALTRDKSWLLGEQEQRQQEFEMMSRKEAEIGMGARSPAHSRGTFTPSSPDVDTASVISESPEAHIRRGRY
jgi:hypothetical protein